MIRIDAIRPTKKAASSACSCATPIEWKKSDRCGAMLVQSGASAAPSNVTEPIITATRAPVPGRGSRCGGAERGGGGGGGRGERREAKPIARPRRSKTEMREKRL